MKKRILIFRFNLIEIALALVILAVGLSSVMVLFPVGMKASRAGVAENNLADVAERVAAYVQSEYTSPKIWNDKGEFSGEGEISKFETEAVGSPSSGGFDDTEVDGVDGLIKKVDNGKTYYLYRQYSETATGTNDDQRPIDFEAIVRVGWDTDTLQNQYYPDLAGSATPPQLVNYSRTPPSNFDDPGKERLGTGSVGMAVLDKCCRTLIIEISWPADVPWENRERRIFRVEMFNENFVPYPQTTDSGSSGGGTNP